jgi:hypothetical protein
MLPSGLIFDGNTISGIPTDNYPLSTTFYANYSNYPNISAEIICTNNILVGTSFADDLQYINGIGVVSYHIETKQQEMPEFYTPAVPYIVSGIVSGETDNFSAYGWLYNTENILADINESYSNIEDSPISAFQRDKDANNKILYYKSVMIPVTCNYTGVSGILSGTLEYNSGTHDDYICYGYMSGYLCHINNMNKQILVDAYCTGKMESNKGIQNSYYLKTLSRNVC